MNIAAGLGGAEPGPGGHIRQSDQPGVTLYVQVGDLGVTLARAVELGGVKGDGSNRSSEWSDTRRD